jgi:leucyl aminopeptidase (aminopeptidase T)
MVSDVGLASALDRVIEGALGVVAGERVLIVHDAAHDQIAEFCSASARVLRADSVTFRLEDFGLRPHAHLPYEIVQALPNVQASLLAVNFHKGELAMRTEMVDRAAAAQLRHGHMVGVQRESIIAGFSVHPKRIAEKARALLVRFGPTSRITVKSKSGTDLTATLSPKCRWMDFGALVLRGKRVNLPGGEIVTSPEDVSGVYVAEGTLGDADGLWRKALRNTPVTLRIASSRITSVECPRDPTLARMITERLAKVGNLDRVGLLGFGVNLGLSEPVGDVFSDQKVPGVHLSLGETFPVATGASWTSKSWVALTALGLSQDIDIDSSAVMRSGRYLL